LEDRRQQPSKPTQRQRREKLIATTLGLCAKQGYECTTVDQIAAAAGITPREFTRYFASKDAVIMSLVNDLLQATVAALAHVDADTDSTEALLIATTEMLTAIIEGCGVMTRDRMLAMAHIITTTRDLQKQASATRKQVLTQGLAHASRSAPSAACRNNVVGNRGRHLPRPPIYASQLRSAPR
jgi:AcrR family transcriptional regulator